MSRGCCKKKRNQEIENEVKGPMPVKKHRERDTGTERLGHFKEGGRHRRNELQEQLKKEDCALPMIDPRTSFGEGRKREEPVTGKYH